MTKMIRMGRVCLFGKNNCNFPLFTQRSACLPKQIFVEFSAFPDEISKHEETKRSRSSVKKPLNATTNSEQKVEFGDLKGAYSDTFNIEFSQQRLFRNLNKNVGVQHTPNEVIQVLKTMAEKKTRPREYLKELCTTLLTKKGHQYTTWECSDLFYALAKLSVKNLDLIELFVEKLKQIQDFESPKVASSLIYSFSRLQYRDVKLIDRLLKYVNQFEGDLKNSLSCLVGVALLNYYSPEVEHIIKFLQQFDEIDHQQTPSYLDFVWACVILNKEDMVVDHISKILGEKFASKFLDHGGNTSLKWKLLNVNGAAQIMPSYDGPLLQKNPVFRILSLSLPKQTNPFLDAVKDTLTYVFPKDGILKMLVQTGSGFYLDFEYIEETNAESQTSANMKKKSKVGIVLINFKDICSDGTLSGLPAFKLRILKGLGYKTTYIRYDEFPFCDPLSEKISILKNKIENLEEN